MFVVMTLERQNAPFYCYHFETFINTANTDDKNVEITLFIVLILS
jgi:hypothetical protein